MNEFGPQHTPDTTHRPDVTQSPLGGYIALRLAQVSAGIIAPEDLGPGFKRAPGGALIIGSEWAGAPTANSNTTPETP